MPHDWALEAIRPIAMLRSAGERAVVRGRVAELLGPTIAAPKGVELPEGGPPLGRTAVLRVDTEEMRRFERPTHRRHDEVRQLWLRDASARALVQVDEARRGELELHLGRPFVAREARGQNTYLRAVALGEELVVGGTVRFEVAAAGASGSYREAPQVPVLEADMICDLEAWESLCAWQALPWHRKLSLIVLNR